jgi:hypothetical protein
LKKSSETNWMRVDGMTDAEIDTSDIPALDDSFFSAAQWRMPEESPVNGDVEAPDMRSE